MPTTATPAAVDFRRLFESAPGSYLVLALDLTIVAASDAYLRATMTERDKILGKGIFDVFPDNPKDSAADGVANLRASLERVLLRRASDAMAVQKYDVRRPQAEGGGFEERYWSPVNSPVFGSGGELAFIIHRVEDVTEFVRVKQREIERHRLNEVLETRASALEAEIFSRAQQLQEANDALRDLQSGLESRVLARTADLVRTNEALQQEIAERCRAEEALRLSEEQLRQSQKLEAVGLLAGGVAHDFNNLLTVILSYSELLLAGKQLNAEQRSALEDVKYAGERGADLVRQLLAFSSRQVLDPQVLDPNEIVSGLQSMIARLLGEDVRLEMKLDPEIGPVRADRGQLEQVVMNLSLNARDAMPQGGTLTVETRNIELREGAVSGFDISPGRHVMVRVADSGVGMDSATQTRIFEPFFTTKLPGKGTGLGLSTVFGIVKQNRGAITLDSACGAGTTFRVYLPRAQHSAERTVAEPSATPLWDGHATILLAEDDEQIRNVVRGTLRGSGYHLLVASGAEHALQICRDHDGAIDLLLTDVVMPGMNGRELAEAVCAIRPEVRVLFMSGYTDDVILERGGLASKVAFLSKPFRPNQLASKIRDVLRIRHKPATEVG